MIRILICILSLLISTGAQAHKLHHRIRAVQTAQHVPTNQDQFSKRLPLWADYVARDDGIHRTLAVGEGRARIHLNVGRNLYRSVLDRPESRQDLSGRPRAWCGFWLRHNVDRDPGVEYNLARNWAHWGRPASGPAPGVIGVMPHHVFKVVQVLGHGTVLAISGNDSHAVRTRPRSTAGVIAWRW